MSAQEGGVLSSIFEQKPILKFWVYYLTFLKLRLMTRSIIGLRFWETFYQLLKWKKLKRMSKSIKNCANYLRNQLIVDSTEQPIVRPIDYELQKDYYSGKKKMHTLKNQFIVLPQGYCRCYCWWSGKTSDIVSRTPNKFESQKF